MSATDVWLAVGRARAERSFKPPGPRFTNYERREPLAYLFLLFSARLAVGGKSSRTRTLFGSAASMYGNMRQDGGAIEKWNRPERHHRRNSELLAAVHRHRSSDHANK